MGRLSREQEQDVCRRALAGERYDQILKDLAAQGIPYSKPAITKLVQRVQKRALEAPPTAATDPVTGVEVEITDELQLATATRELSALFQRIRRGESVDADRLEQLISIAHVLPKLTTARHRVRQPPPEPKPTEKPQPGQPPEPKPEHELTKEEAERRAWEGLN